MATLAGATACFVWTAGTLLAQTGGIPGAGEAAPTTIVGAMIAVTMSMVGGYWLIIKRLFETVDAIQKTFAVTVEKLIEDRKADREASAERAKAEREAHAEQQASMQKALLTLARQNQRGAFKPADDDSPPEGVR